MLTQKRLRELLRYHPGTGIFTWLVRTSNRICVGDVAGCSGKHGHIRINVDGVPYLAHRLAWFYMKGVWPQFEIDHKDTVSSNNAWKNLRDVTHIVNLQNQRKAHCDNKTGFQGVSANGEGFMSEIMLTGERHYLGTHQTPELAHQTYLDAKRELHVGCTL